MSKTKTQTIFITFAGLLIIIGICFYFLLADGTFASAKPEAANKALLEAQLQRDNASNKHLVDSSLKLLKSGDLVVRTGIDVTSSMLCQMNQLDKTYSHCGIVMVENGYPFVYHSIGGEDNPNARLRRDSANFFFSPYNNMGFGIARYDLNKIQINKLGKTVRKYYKERRKFDMDFDLKTDDRLYCAEMVYKALRAATADSNYIQLTHIFGYTFVGIDNLFHNRHTRQICQIKFK